MKLNQKQLRGLIEGIVKEDKDRNKERNAAERSKKRRKPGKPFKKGVNPFTKQPIKEIGPSRTRIDASIRDEMSQGEVQEIGFELAEKILNDRSLAIHKHALNFAAKKLASSGIGGPEVPAITGSELADIIPDTMDDAKRELESNIAVAISNFLTTIIAETADQMTAYAEDGHDPDYLRGPGAAK